MQCCITLCCSIVVLHGFGHSAELYIVPGTQLSQHSFSFCNENGTINYSCHIVSDFVSFLLAFCVVCAYFCLAIAFESFLLAFCVVQHATLQHM